MAKIRGLSLFTLTVLHPVLSEKYYFVQYSPVLHKNVRSKKISPHLYWPQNAKIHQVLRIKEVLLDLFNGLLEATTTTEKAKSKWESSAPDFHHHLWEVLLHLRDELPFAKDSVPKHEDSLKARDDESWIGLQFRVEDIFTLLGPTNPFKMLKEAQFPTESDSYKLHCWYLAPLSC